MTFADPAVAQEATANPNPTIDNRRANCNLAALGAKRPSDGGNGGGYGGGGGGGYGNGGGYGTGSPRGGGRGGRRFDYNGGGMSRGGGGGGRGGGGGGRGNYQNQHQQQYYQPQHQQLQPQGGYFIGPNGQPVFQPQFFQMGMPMPQMQPNGGGYQMAAPIDLQGGIAIPADATQMQVCAFEWKRMTSLTQPCSYYLLVGLIQRLSFSLSNQIFSNHRFFPCFVTSPPFIVVFSTYSCNRAPSRRSKWCMRLRTAISRTHRTIPRLSSRSRSRSSRSRSLSSNNSNSSSTW